MGVNLIFLLVCKEMRDTILSLNISNLSIYIIYINTKDLNKTASISYQIDILEKVIWKVKE